jgi:predicted house-cleaning noncanonical NTP pyrophosphatase (MazG superfamily)
MIQLKKLVRDKIPQQSRGGELKPIEGLRHEELEHYYRMKIMEEAGELFGATEKLNIIEEAADLMEITIAFLAKIHRIDLPTIQEYMKVKREQKGGFLHGRVCEIGDGLSLKGLPQYEPPK